MVTSNIMDINILDLDGNIYDINTIIMNGNDEVNIIIKKPNEDYIEYEESKELLKRCLYDKLFE